MEDQENVVVPFRANGEDRDIEVSHWRNQSVEFAWRANVDSKPRVLRVYPYAMSWAELIATPDRIAEAENHGLELRRLETQVLTMEMDEEDTGLSPDEKDRLATKQARIAELKAKPSVEQIVTGYFTTVVESWPFTNEGEPIPLGEKGIKMMPSQLLVQLREDITDFFTHILKKRKKR